MTTEITTEIVRTVILAGVTIWLKISINKFYQKLVDIEKSINNQNIFNARYSDKIELLEKKCSEFAEKFRKVWEKLAEIQLTQKTCKNLKTQ